MRVSGNLFERKHENKPLEEKKQKLDWDKPLSALVTGDTGFIGSHMKRFLLERGSEVMGYSLRNGFDILNLNQLREAAKKVDVIYHFAAEAKPGPSVLNPMHSIEINIKGTLNVLEACREYNLSCVYPSSCEVYGDSDLPITEEFEFRPTNPYAASKAAADRICYMYSQCYGLDVKLLRFFNPYGPRQQLNKVIPVFYFHAKKNLSLPVFGKGTDTRDYVYIDDIISGCWLAKKLPPGEAVNLATGKVISNLQLAKLVIDLTNSKSSIKFVEYPKAFGGIKNQVGSYEKASKLMGWKPETSLVEGIKRTIDWLEGVELQLPPS